MNEVNCTSIQRGLDCGITGFMDFAMRLIRKGKWDCRRGAMRCAYCTLLAKPCQRGWRLLILTLSRKGRGDRNPRGGGDPPAAWCPIPLDARMPNRFLIQPLSVMANRLVDSKNRITRAGRWLATRGAALFAELSEFQQRIWVVSIVNDTYTDTFIVNEGSFEEPMQWMRRKQYNADMLQRVDAMQRSQVIQFELGDIRHRLMRVK